MGPGTATADFETFSRAGYVWSAERHRWVRPRGAQKAGLPAVGTLAYAQHPSTEVLSLHYRLPGGPLRRWHPWSPELPHDLFEHLAAGGLLEAHHAMMERATWYYVCERKYGFPPLPAGQLRCSSATARVNTYPGALDDLSKVLPLDVAKDADGKRLIQKFCVPRNPTKGDGALRRHLADDLEDAERLFSYGDRDVLAEESLRPFMRPMSDAELRAWQVDQEINWRGVGVDVEGVDKLARVVDTVMAEAEVECSFLTGGVSSTQVEALTGWLRSEGGLSLPDLTAGTITDALKRDDLQPDTRRVLEIRQASSSASVKKLFAMQRMATPDRRLKGLYFHHGARTGRPTGADTQPTNMPRSGPAVAWCYSCLRPSTASARVCRWCGSTRRGPKRKWGPECVEYVLLAANAGARGVEWIFDETLSAVAGSLRGMFVAAEGHDLIASDYSQIEAVVLAKLADERWKVEAFERDDPVYLMTASGITGVPVEEYLRYARETGDHHPDRQTYGKTADLAGGYGGWIGAYRAFDDTLPDDEIRRIILGWREKHPATVELWGGQSRGRPWDNLPRDLFGLEGTFIKAFEDPNRWHCVNRYLALKRVGDDVWLRLPSGREICYHEVSLGPHARWDNQQAISFKGWNTNPKMGPRGWVSLNTYGGRVTENATQATAHDIQRHSLQILEEEGYPIVLHVYDENVAEVPEGFGSVAEFEAFMMRMPSWARGWPIRAKGGYRAKRFRKG